VARDFQIEGPCLAFVKGGAHMSGQPIMLVSELGLSDDSVRIEPRFRHGDIRADDFGPDMAAEAQWLMSDALIKMTLVHFDFQVLDICYSESMGGGSIDYGVLFVPDNVPLGEQFEFANGRAGIAGTNAAAGTLMGNGLPMFMSGNHLISLTLSSPYAFRPWRFRSCYLADRPIIHPVGTKYSKVELTWRAIPYAPIYVSGLETEVCSNTNLPYRLPPGTVSGIYITQDIGLAADDPGRYYLTREILSSGICVWDRLADLDNLTVPVED
jgi:hypothetical protein